MQEFTADAIVHSHTASDVVNVAADGVAKIGYFVDKGDLGREKGVRRVFDKLRRFEGSDDDRRFDQIKRAIQVLHHRDRVRFIAADDDAVGTHKIFDRRAFAQNSGFEATPKFVSMSSDFR